MLKRPSLLILALALAAAALAQKGLVAPSDAMPNTLKVAKEIKWHGSVDASLALARKQNKLVFFVQMLGKIDGDT